MMFLTSISSCAVARVLLHLRRVQARHWWPQLQPPDAAPPVRGLEQQVPDVPDHHVHERRLPRSLPLPQGRHQDQGLPRRHRCEGDLLPGRTWWQDASSDYARANDARAHDSGADNASPHDAGADDARAIHACAGRYGKQRALFGGRRVSSAAAETATRRPATKTTASTPERRLPRLWPMSRQRRRL
jgi:hypothetical protein